MSEENTKSPLPPYLAFKTFLNFIDGFRTSGLPGRIDKSVMSGQSGGTQSSLMATLKFLKLIQDDGTPTPALVTLVKQSPEDSKKTYAELVSKQYAFVSTKGVNLETATEGQLEEVFRNSGFSGDTVRKAMTFFVLLATEAGMKVSAHLKAAKRKATGHGGGAQRKPRKKAGAEGSAPPFNPPTPPPQNEPEGHKTYQLDLATDGKRFVKVTAPINLTAAEIARITGWMGFQFNISLPAKT